MLEPSADRELRAERLVAAPPSVVWAALTDLTRMPDWSPELVRMVALRPGGLRVGQQYLGINRRKGVVWPTRSVVAVLEEGVTLAWDTRTSGSRWIYELVPEGHGTRVVHRRPVPRRLTRSGRVFAALALGGAGPHAGELEAGMARTLAGLAAAVER
ncbi:SRPBCC family protein [Nocardioides okcheonensis]|uniref:SRPBCC family protein n=1 Tax=Nocardioides okcheonensis TaxID=2894081 RepID=UPI001E59AF7D|nr:SRPBCC family protein [Nocardioides okcheonensis]UFN45938.1 SRPBCC family protein [Nocardioides okcheonensis]